MEIKHLELEDSEKNELSRLARESKSLINEREAIYSTSIDRIKIFIDYYLFLSINSKNVVLKLEIRNKIKRYLEQFSELFLKFEELMDKLRRIVYGKNRLIQKIEFLSKDNISYVEILISDVFPLGKIVKSYDPEGSIGYS